mgnify:CR=1 FL=1|tara:strand:- start:120 stop:626 length:507 start_codon:yes stop_codon:yes gene_type:complete
MMEEFLEHTLEPHFNFWIYVILMMIGLWAVIAKNNMIKKLIGLSIFQTAIILFYVSLGVKDHATIPILDHHAPAEESVEHGETDHGKPTEKTASSDHSQEKHHEAEAHAIDPDTMANPLPHVLMLTAIVVGVATLGVALALTQRIFKEFGSIEEDEILTIIKGGNADE